MKTFVRTAIFVAAAFAFPACKQEAENPAIEVEEGEIHVSITTADPASKTATEDGAQVLWLDTDRLGVSNATDSNDAFTPTFQGSVTQGAFEGTLASAGTYYAYYPYTQTLSEGQPVLDFPSSQTQQANGSFDAAADILVSKPLSITQSHPTVEASFKRLVAFLKVSFNNQSGANLDNELLSSVTVSVDSYAPLAGMVTLDLPAASLGDVIEGESSVTVLHGNGLPVSGVSMLGVLPQTLSAGTRMTISAQSEHYTLSKSISLASDLVLTAGHVLPIAVKLTEADVTYKLPGGSDAYVLVKNVADLEDGDEILIVSPDGDYVMGGQSGNFRLATSVTVENESISEAPSDAAVITLGISGDDWTLSAPDGYLAAQSANSNYLKTVSSVDNYAKWSISINGDGDATVKALSGSRNQMRYNYNNGSPRFSCYGSSTSLKTEVRFYRKSSVPANPEYVTQWDQLGLYLGSTVRTYVPGTDQYVRFHEGNALTYVLLDPAQKEQMVISGYKSGFAVGTSVTVNVAWRKDKTEVLSQNYKWYVLKTSDDKVWMGDAKGKGVIISR